MCVMYTRNKKYELWKTLFYFKSDNQKIVIELLSYEWVKYYPQLYPQLLTIN